MKQKDLILIGGLCLGGYLLYKYLQEQGNYAAGGNGGGGFSFIPVIGPHGGPGGNGTTNNGNKTKQETVVQATPPILNAGTTIVQVPSPGITFKSPQNTVYVQPGVKTGQVTVVPAKVGTAYAKAPYKPTPAQPPLNIQTIFGKQIMPRLSPVSPFAPGSTLLRKLGGR